MFPVRVGDPRARILYTKMLPAGWSDKTKLILISTLVEVLVEVELELGNLKGLRLINSLDVKSIDFKIQIISNPCSISLYIIL